MMADNNNQAYLVSVEKCIKQAKKMADMGTAALGNISQILQFLKIEKLHSLLTDEEELGQLERDLAMQLSDESLQDPKFIAKIMGTTTQVSGQPSQPTQVKNLMTFQDTVNDPSIADSPKKKELNSVRQS